MKVHNITEDKVIFIDTDVGNYKIYSNGSMKIWCDDRLMYRWLDPDEYKDKDIIEVRQAATRFQNENI